MFKRILHRLAKTALRSGQAVATVHRIPALAVISRMFFKAEIRRSHVFHALTLWRGVFGAGARLIALSIKSYEC